MNRREALALMAASAMGATVPAAATVAPSSGCLVFGLLWWSHEVTSTEVVSRQTDAIQDVFDRILATDLTEPNLL